MDGGLGSSHTAPCGTAGPARPPTHRKSRLAALPLLEQWPNSPTKQGTGVLVLLGAALEVFI